MTNLKTGLGPYFRLIPVLLALLILVDAWPYLSTAPNTGHLLVGKVLLVVAILAMGGFGFAWHRYVVRHQKRVQHEEQQRQTIRTRTLQKRGSRSRAEGL